MKQRGRPSSTSMEIMTGPAMLERVERLKAPHELTDEETEIWSAVINTEPADWFSKSIVPLLAQYCRHVIQAKRIAELIEHATSDKDLLVKDYDRLLKMQERESRSMIFLATKMRITNQATINHRGNKIKREDRKPWEA